MSWNINLGCFNAREDNYNADDDGDKNEHDVIEKTILVGLSTQQNKLHTRKILVTISFHSDHISPTTITTAFR